MRPKSPVRTCIILKFHVIIFLRSLAEEKEVVPPVEAGNQAFFLEDYKKAVILIEDGNKRVIIIFV